jgi:hypothetical protein
MKGLGLLRRHESPIIASGPGPEAVTGGLGVVRHGANKRRFSQSLLGHGAPCRQHDPSGSKGAV